MNEKGCEKNRITEGAAWTALILLLGLEFLLHRSVKFMMDDLWYGTNLVTGEPLRSFADVVESQVWHFYNWGGRNMTHGLLQIVLMTGEWGADLLNLLMTLLLGWMICKTADVKNQFGILTAETLLVGLNANVKMSMFWQSGTVNYVYSTVWLLFFLWVYLRQLKEPDSPPLRGCAVWILPLGLAAGWSNENMGPACMLAALGIILYLRFAKKRKISVWMAEGVVASTLGSILVIVAPGNFARASTIEKTGIWTGLYQRCYAFLGATGDFLFPVLVMLAAVILIYICVCKGRLESVHIVLLLTALAAHGAMFLSPHYPDRATFGIMVLCITVIISLLGKIWVQHEAGRRWIVLILSACFLNAVFMIGQYLLFNDLLFFNS